MEGSGGTLDERLARIAEFAREARTRGARLLALPEMSVTGYDLSYESAGEPIPGPITTALTEIAREKDLYLISGMTELDAGSRFNVLTLIGPEGRVGGYRKQHVSSVENAFWLCGEGATVLTCDIGRIGFGICADMLFPTPWSAYQGDVDLVVIGAAWPDHRHTKPFPYGARFSETHVKATEDVPLHLSAALGVPVLLANAAGSFDACLPPFGNALRGRFAGRSCIADGEIITRAGTEETLLVATVHREKRTPAGVLEPWLPRWSRRFRIAARGGDVALGLVYRTFYRGR